MRTVPRLFLAIAFCGLSAGLPAEDRASDAPGRAPPGGLLLEDLASLSAAALMQAESAPAAPAAPVPEPPQQPPPILRNWTVKGYAEFAYIWNFNRPENSSPADRPAKENAYRIFDVNHNEFQLDAITLDVSKEATDDSWIGFRAVALAGQDARWLHAAGLFDGGTGAVSGDGEDFDLVDAYVTLRIPAIATTFRLGKWETTHGAEVLESHSNINYSHSYLFGYAIPITHTGIAASTTILRREKDSSELLGTDLGIVNGWDNVKDNNDAKSYMGQVRFSPCSEFESRLAAMVGPEQESDEADWRGLVDIVATVKFWGPLEDLSISGNYDYGWEDNASPGGDYAEWYGFAGYVKYKLAKIDFLKKFYLGFRGEWFNDRDGARTGIDGGEAMIGLTTTLGYRPLENLLLRFEHRYDKADDDVFNERHDRDANHQNTVAMNIVVTY